jgi:hypothetical protein
MDVSGKPSACERNGERLLAGEIREELHDRHAAAVIAWEVFRRVSYLDMDVVIRPAYR